MTEKQVAPTIIVEARSVYGCEKLYPASPDALLLASIAGTKTLSRAALKCAAAMGCVVTVQATVEQVTA